MRTYGVVDMSIDEGVDAALFDDCCGEIVFVGVVHGCRRGHHTGRARMQELATGQRGRSVRARAGVGEGWEDVRGSRGELKRKGRATGCR